MDQHMSSRIIEYVQHDDRAPSRHAEAPVWAFLFDIGYLGGCGVFPPLHLLNQVLLTGGKHPGVTGTSWEPFELSRDEYTAILPSILSPDTVALQKYSRFPWQRFGLDGELDGCTDYIDWQRKACAKHGTEHGARLAAIQHELVSSSTGSKS